MEFLQPDPLPVMQLTPASIRAVAKWLAEPDAAGYSWYEGAAARFRTPIGEFNAPMHSWIVKIGSHPVALTTAEFDALFSSRKEHL